MLQQITNFVNDTNGILDKMPTDSGCIMPSHLIKFFGNLKNIIMEEHIKIINLVENKFATIKNSYIDKSSKPKYMATSYEDHERSIYNYCIGLFSSNYQIIEPFVSVFQYERQMYGLFWKDRYDVHDSLDNVSISAIMNEQAVHNKFAKILSAEIANIIFPYLGNKKIQELTNNLVKKIKDKLNMLMECDLIMPLIQQFAELYNMVKNESDQIIKLIRRNESETKTVHSLNKLFPVDIINTILQHSTKDIIFQF
jgi:hypothetical protein